MTFSTILFLHGGGLSARMWQPQIERLPEFRCLAPDLPGHGQLADVALSIPDTVRRLADLLRQETPGGRAHVVGLSYGGVVAQALMVHHPELVDHVILSGTSVRLSGLLFGILKLQAVLNRPLLKLLSPSQIAWLTAVQFGIPPEFRQAMGEDMRLVSADSFLALSLAYGEIETPPRFERPVLVCVGEKETLPAKMFARRLVRQMDGSRGVSIPCLGHVWNLQSPELFSQVVRAWVTDASLPGEIQDLKV